MTIKSSEITVVFKLEVPSASLVMHPELNMILQITKTDLWCNDYRCPLEVAIGDNLKNPKGYYYSWFLCFQEYLTICGSQIIVGWLLLNSMS